MDIYKEVERLKFVPPVKPYEATVFRIFYNFADYVHSVFFDTFKYIKICIPVIIYSAFGIDSNNCRCLCKIQP